MTDLVDNMHRTEFELRRGVIRERPLCCPRCGGKVVLCTARLMCVEPTPKLLTGCGWSGTRLAELAEVT